MARVPPWDDEGRAFEPKYGAPFFFDDDLEINENRDPLGPPRWVPYDLTGLTITFQLFTEDFVLVVEADAVSRSGNPIDGSVRFAATALQMTTGIVVEADGRIARHLAQWVIKSAGEVVDVVPRGPRYRPVVFGRMPVAS